MFKILKTFLRNIILQMFSEVITITLELVYIRNMRIESPITQITQLKILITIVMVLQIITKEIQ